MSKENDNLNINQEDLEALLNNASLDDSPKEELDTIEFEDSPQEVKRKEDTLNQTTSSNERNIEVSDHDSKNQSNIQEDEVKLDGDLADFDFSGINDIQFDDVSPPKSESEDILEISQEDLMKELMDVPNPTSNLEDEFNPDEFTTDNDDLELEDENNANENKVQECSNKKQSSIEEKVSENDIIEIDMEENDNDEELLSNETMRRKEKKNLNNEELDDESDKDDIFEFEDDNSIKKGINFKSLIIIILMIIAIFITGKTVLKHFDLNISNNDNITETEIYSSYEELSQDIEDTLMNLSLYLNNRISLDVLVTNLENTYVSINESANKEINNYNTQYSQYHQLLINGIKDATKTSDIDNSISNYINSINELSIAVDEDIEKFLKSNNIEYVKTENGITITEK